MLLPLVSSDLVSHRSATRLFINISDLGALYDY